MSKTFKTKKHKKYYFRKIILYIFFILIFIYIFYNIFYNLYLSKLNNKELIDHIIANTKNNSSFFITKIANPETIIKNNFVLKEQEEPINNISNINASIYIYSTHETESYSDKYLEIYNIKPTVKTISYILKDYLTDLGISCIVESRSITDILHNHNWSYKYSYDASRELILEPIKNNNYSLIIDLHRDSSILEKTLLSYNNKQYAKILFVVGKDHDNYEQNLKVAETLNNIANELIPDISRGISIKSGEGVNGIYNQDINSNMVLIEVGGQYNEIEELNNTIAELSRIILTYLERTK